MFFLAEGGKILKTPELPTKKNRRKCRNPATLPLGGKTGFWGCVVCVTHCPQRPSTGSGLKNENTQYPYSTQSRLGGVQCCGKKQRRTKRLKNAKLGQEQD